MCFHCGRQDSWYCVPHVVIKPVYKWCTHDLQRFSLFAHIRSTDFCIDIRWLPLSRVTSTQVCTESDGLTPITLWLSFMLCQPNTSIYGLLWYGGTPKVPIKAPDFSHYPASCWTYLTAVCEVLFSLFFSLRFYQLNRGAQVCSFDLSLESFHMGSTLTACCYSHDALLHTALVWITS